MRESFENVDFSKFETNVKDRCQIRGALKNAPELPARKYWWCEPALSPDLKEGISIDDDTWNALKAIANKVGLGDKLDGRLSPVDGLKLADAIRLAIGVLFNVMEMAKTERGLRSSVRRHEG